MSSHDDVITGNTIVGLNNHIVTLNQGKTMLDRNAIIQLEGRLEMNPL